MNQRLSKGVTPQNNANVLIWNALGPRPEGMTFSPEFFKWMGIKAPPKKGDYWISLGTFVQKRMPKLPYSKTYQFYDQLEALCKKPWNPKQHALFSDWLQANKKPLALIIQAAKRPKYVAPIWTAFEDGKRNMLMQSRNPTSHVCRGIASALITRAMMFVDQKRFGDAWLDIITCYRLGRHIAGGGTIIDYLAGSAIEKIAMDGTLRFLQNTRLNSAQIQTKLGDLKRVPPIPSTADTVSFGERFSELDAIVKMYEWRFQDKYTGKKLKNQNPFDKFVADSVDWDLALEMTNEYFDMFDKALRQESFAKREKELIAIGRKLSKIKVVAVNRANVRKVFLNEKQPRKILGKMLGNIFLSLAPLGVFKICDQEIELLQQQRNMQVAFALAAYHADQQRYPTTLGDLVPKYRAKLPADIFTGKSLIYRPAKSGYVLYSVGYNKRDDQAGMRSQYPEWDDLPVWMPYSDKKPRDTPKSYPLPIPELEELPDK